MFPPLLLCRLVQQLDGEGMSNLGGVFDVKQVPGTQQVSGLQLGGGPMGGAFWSLRWSNTRSATFCRPCAGHECSSRCFPLLCVKSALLCCAVDPPGAAVRVQF